MNKFLFLFFALIGCSPIFSQNQELWLDQSFSDDGMLNYFTQNYADIPSAVKVDHDNKIIVISSSVDENWYQLAISRVNEDGTLDETFANNGVFLAPGGRTHDTYSQTVIIDDLNRIVFSGVTDGMNDSAFVARLMPDGTPDLTFSNTGFRYYQNTSGYLGVGDMAVDDSGNYYLYGKRYYSNAADSVDVVKILPDGNLDDSFANHGFASMDIGVNSNAMSFELLPDGRFLGTVTYFNQNVSPDVSSSFLTVFNSDGSIDDSFGVNGILNLENLFEGQENVSDTYLDENGDLYMTITHYENTNKIASIVKLNADLSINTDFGVGGYASHPAIDGDVDYLSIDVLEGKILAIGSVTLPGISKALVSMFDMSGMPISSFGLDGTLQVSLPNTYPSDNGYRGEILPDGKIVAAGRSTSDNLLASIGVFRLLPEPLIDDVSNPEYPRLSLYPNPAGDKLHISNPSAFKIMTFSIYDAQGKLLKTQRDGLMNIIPVDELLEGIYFLKIETDDHAIQTLMFTK